MGRPRGPGEVRALIARMARDNPRWGTERVRGELRTLGSTVSAGSIHRSRWRRPARPPSQSWRTFLRHHAAHSCAADPFTGPTLTVRTLSVVCFVTHDRRALVHRRVTAIPTATWVWRQLLEAAAWGRQPTYLVRGRDSVYGRVFPRKAQRLGIGTLLTPFRAPRADALAERVIRTLRQECVDHVLVPGERHLQAVLQGYVDDDTTARPHRRLALVPPLSATRALETPCASSGRIVVRPVLGGLHHVYERAA
jgi:transposase InsO family protein